MEFNGGRRTVRLRRGAKIFTQDAARSDNITAFRYTAAQLRHISLDAPSQHSEDAIEAAVLAAGVSRFSDARQHPDPAFSRHDTEVLLQRTPVKDPGLDFYLPDVILLRKGELLSVLHSMGQTVSKQAPTRLELLGVTVTILCSLGRLSV